MSKAGRWYLLKKVLSGLMAVVFALGSAGSSYCQNVVALSAPGSRVALSAAFAPPLLKGVKVYPDNPFRLDYILDQGDGAGNDQGYSLPEESSRLIKYFLAAITVPESDLWVTH
ncbi:MAG: hypothetical protein HQL20_02475 [Candidatus Omnitrophica bacterium]|nr:hypothetical protein [Candidatus Omnitrophota bacterium]